jgi:type IV pilus assembly protein PilC
MASFSYTGICGNSGERTSSILEALSEEEAIKTLLERQVLVVSISQMGSTAGNRKSVGKVQLKDLVIFTRQFATMFDAGMSIVACFKGLEKETSSKVMRDVISDLIARISRGDNLHDAMARHPKVFDKLYLCMIQAGEKGGLLADVLARVATYLENSARLRRKVKSAMTYPTAVTVVAISITIFLLVKVVPVFGEIFDSFRGKLPAPTLALIQISNFMKAHFFLILLAMGGSVFGFLSALRTERGRRIWDARRIRLPIFGKLAHNICISRFARTFASLTRSGVPILSVMQTASRACGNVIMEEALLAASVDIQNGQGISDSMAKHPVFPDMLLRMMSAGEQTGKIDNMMERIADYLDEEIETTINGLTSLIEPILIVFLGVVVGGIVICMFLPIFKLSTLVNSNH